MNRWHSAVGGIAMRRITVTSFVAAAVLAAPLAAPLAAFATCPPSCAIPGGGAPTTDCQAEFAGSGLRLNYKPFDPLRPKPGKEVRCFDGDAVCDVDDTVDNACTFDVDVCLRNPDPALPLCTPVDVTSVSVGGATNDPDLAALQSALTALLPATSNVCTSGRTLHVPLKGPDARGRFKLAKKKVKLTTMTTTGVVDVDTLKLTCI